MGWRSPWLPMVTSASAATMLRQVRTQLPRCCLWTSTGAPMLGKLYLASGSRGTLARQGRAVRHCQGGNSAVRKDQDPGGS